MTLIVETGSGVAGANSYISAADATTYINAYADNSNWPTDQPTQEAYLIQAAQALELNWGPKYASCRVFGTQPMLWPRYAFYDVNSRLILQGSIPVELMNAQAELALAVAAGTDMFPNAPKDDSITQNIVTVDVITLSTSYSPGAHGVPFSLFKKVDAIMFSILNGMTATRMVR